MTQKDQHHNETPAEERVRSEAQTVLHLADIDRRVGSIETEGFGDALHGILTVLLDPTMGPAPEERQEQIVRGVLRMVAKRDLERETKQP